MVAPSGSGMVNAVEHAAILALKLPAPPRPRFSIAVMASRERPPRHPRHRARGFAPGFHVSICGCSRSASGDSFHIFANAG